MATYNFGNHEIGREHTARARAKRSLEAGVERRQQENQRLMEAAQRWDAAYTFAIEAPPYACRIF